MNKKRNKIIAIAHTLISKFLTPISNNSVEKLSKEFNISKKHAELKEHLDDYFNSSHHQLSIATLKSIINQSPEQDLFFMPDAENKTNAWRISCRIFDNNIEQEISGNFDLILESGKYNLEYLYFSS